MVRVTRGCKWNRCKFCGIYPNLGQPDFSIRPIEEVKHDIDLLKELHPKPETAFLGDSDPLLIPLEDCIELLKYIRNVFPDLKRVTAYARASTLHKKGPDALKKLAGAGLNRVHIGLESGDTEILRFQKKGQLPELVIETGKWLKVAKIEVSFYVLLGLGGKDRWKEHMDGSAAVINAVNPEFIRLRRLWLYSREETGTGECPLWEDIRAGKYSPQTPEGTVLELRRLIEKLDGVTSYIACDHANNYINVKGKMPKDKNLMLEEIDAFLKLPEEERQRHYESHESGI
jgi:hypothetical protein